MTMLRRAARVMTTAWVTIIMLALGISNVIVILAFGVLSMIVERRTRSE